MTGQPYAVRLSAQAAKALTGCPSARKRRSGTSWTPRRPAPAASASGTPVTPDDEDVRIASVGQLSVIYWINRPL